ncbi:MAG TPA: phage portal protein [Lactobacillus sp.]|nr:phage portal protein [Lactobacillus sp.]
MALDTQDLYNRSLLNGHHWSSLANKIYVMPRKDFENSFGSNNLQSITDIVSYFVMQHYTIDAPRITKLQRYYLGDNDIHYWANTKQARGKADNRIASGFAKFITNMRVGYMLGKPIQFKRNDEDGSHDYDKAEELLDDFNDTNDEAYHEKVMKTNLSTTGRAYELLYAGRVTEDGDGHAQTPDVKMRAIDPATAFVVYDTSIDRHSLFGVRYYTVDTLGYSGKSISYVDVYTSDAVYHFKTEDGVNDRSADYQLIGQESTSFGAVPLTEYINNENRTGDWESKLDEIDAYDLAMSDMANSEEDFANAKLMINGDFDFSDNMKTLIGPDGNPLTDKDGEPIKVPNISADDPFIWLKPSITPQPSGGNTIIPASAGYLTKELNETGWQTYIKQLANDIHKDTNTPDMTDEAFSGQSSGVALMYKLFGEDQERSMQESLYSRGLNRRLRLLGKFWSKNMEIGSSDVMNAFKPVYQPNLPKNNSEITAMLVQLSNTSLFSEETLREIAEQVTGISADAEAKRVEEEQRNDQDNPYEFDGIPLQEADPQEVDAAKQKMGLSDTPHPTGPQGLFNQLRGGK